MIFLCPCYKHTFELQLVTTIPQILASVLQLQILCFLIKMSFLFPFLSAKNSICGISMVVLQGEKDNTKINFYPSIYLFFYDFTLSVLQNTIRIQLVTAIPQIPAPVLQLYHFLN